MVNFEFREISRHDKLQLSNFFIENNVPIIARNFTAFPLTSESAELITNQTHKDKFYIYLENNEFMGFSMLRGWDEGFLIPSFGIFIHRDHLGKGLGKLILRLTINEAIKTGCKKVRLSVFSSNTAGINIYKNFGFIEINKTTVIHDGKFEDKIIMIKELL